MSTDILLLRRCDEIIKSFLIIVLCPPDNSGDTTFVQFPALVHVRSEKLIEGPVPKTFDHRLLIVKCNI